MADESLKRRFSAWYHAEAYRYLLPATLAKALAELTLGALVAWLFVALLSLVTDLTAPLGIASLTVRDSLFGVLTAAVFAQLFCVTTLQPDDH